MVCGHQSLLARPPGSASKSGSTPGPLPRALEEIWRNRSWPVEDAGLLPRTSKRRFRGGESKDCLWSGLGCDWAFRCWTAIFSRHSKKHSAENGVRYRTSVCQPLRWNCVTARSPRERPSASILAPDAFGVSDAHRPVCSSRGDAE